MNDRQTDEATHHDLDLAFDGLGRPRLGRPDPALRQRTLDAVRGALAAAPEPGARWRAWRLEAALVAAIFACVLLTEPVDPAVPVDTARPVSEASIETPTLETLGFNGLEPYIRFRLALARREPDPKPRYPTHDISSRTLAGH